MSMQTTMQAHTDALPPSLERSGGSRWRQAAARSEQDRRDVAARPYDLGGTILTASAWLGFYAIAVIHYAIVTIHHLISSGIWN